MQYLDFYLPGLNIAIEYDGKQHFEGSRFFFTTLEEQKLLDKRKNEYLINNDVKFLRFNYKDNLTKELVYACIMEIANEGK